LDVKEIKAVKPIRQEISSIAWKTQYYASILDKSLEISFFSSVAQGVIILQSQLARKNVKPPVSSSDRRNFSQEQLCGIRSTNLRMVY
jgi:hypothetical protein